MDTSQIKKTINLKKDELKTQFHVARIGLFGSVVRNESNTESDIDFLVEFDQKVDLFNIMNLENYLQDIFHKKIDVVTPANLKPYIGQKILKEVVYL